MSLSIGKKLLIAAVLCSCFALIYLLSNFMTANATKLPAEYSDSDLAITGKRLKGFVMGADGMFADWFWIQSLQYLGNKFESSGADYINIENLQPLNPRLLYPYLDSATDLDPHFMAAYSFGATVLPAINPDDAIAFCKKGIANNPDNFRFYQHLGFIYWKLGRFDDAAAAYEAGSRLPNAPQFFSFLAAGMKNQGGSRETARAMYMQLRDSAEAESARENAALHLSRMESEDEILAANDKLKELAAANQCPATTRDIARHLVNIKLPANDDFQITASNELADPSGVPYLFDRAGCSIKLDREKTKVPNN